MVKITFSKHAKEKLIERLIPEEEVINIMQKPIATIPHPTEVGRFKSYGKYHDPVRDLNLYLIIIHTTPMSQRIIIITMYDTDIGGVKANGFNII